MTKPTKVHLTTAQRTYDRLGRGSVADIDAIAAALVAAHQDGIREGKRQAAEIADAVADEKDAMAIAASADEQVFAYRDCERAARHISYSILSTITDESE